MIGKVFERLDTAKYFTGRTGILSRSLWYQDKAQSHNTWEAQSKVGDPYEKRHTPIIDGKIVDLYG